MKKWKYFSSILKERDWLEEMARQGWLLKDMTLGMRYEFEEIEPSEKVYEIEKFSVQGKPTKEKIFARKTALDIAEQSGWKVITHDESMNYYFVKDKAGDESDEFYDEEELRRARAEKFRDEFGQNVMISQLKSMLVFTICFLIYFAILSILGTSFAGLAWIYIVWMLMEIALCVYALKTSKGWYEELCLSREEWEHRKRFGEKKKFKKTAELLSYLQKKAENGLVLTQYAEENYLFEETTQRYQYEIDTFKALKNRCKAKGEVFKNEEKDWSDRRLKWYEQSMAEAQSMGFELVTIIEGDNIVYRRALQDGEQPVYLNPGHNEPIGWSQKVLLASGGFLVLLVVVFVISFMVGMYFAKIG